VRSLALLPTRPLESRQRATTRDYGALWRRVGPAGGKVKRVLQASLQIALPNHQLAWWFLAAHEFLVSMCGHRSNETLNMPVEAPERLSGAFSRLH